MSVADHSENPAEKRSKPPLVTRFLGFLGFTPSSSDAGAKPCASPPPSTPPPPVPQAKNGVVHLETFDELVRLAEASPVPAQRSNLEDTRIINLQRQSEELSQALMKKGDTCKRRLTGIRERIQEKIRESEELNSRESD